ncbi:MAG: DUF2207 domain-containing protein, partial [Patescibacteria group bacterium]
AQTAEEIRSFAGDVSVGEDGLVRVIEHISYFFPAPKHGIYRDIPTEYVTKEGKRSRIPIDVVSVTGRGGSAWRYTVENNDVGIRIKIGDPDQNVSGEQTYDISYRATGALRYFGDHDELYWNATGTGWTVPIRRATASVTLPNGVPTEKVTRKCYGGAAGSTSTDCLIGAIGNASHFAADGNLTIVVGWPPGSVAKVEAEPVAEPSPWVPFVFPAIIGAVLFAVWWFRGRDVGGRKTIMPQYEPPDGITPAELGTLVDQSADIRDITSTIVDLAVRGWLKSKEGETKGLLFTSKDFEFELLKPAADPSLKPHEKLIVSSLFGGLPSVRLSTIKKDHLFYLAIPDIKKKLYGQMIALNYFSGNPENIKGLYGLLAAVVIFIGYSFTSALAGQAGSPVNTTRWVALAITAIICFIFVPAMARRTATGALAYEHALGFKDYLATAEKYRLQWQEKELIFEKFLPYAMVLGVADKWAKTFADLGLPPPTWYEGSASASGVFNAVAFTSSMRSFDSSVSAAMVSAPQQTSSGSGFSGGSAGGGGGGGGGGSW